jgi:hypothetical protein
MTIKISHKLGKWSVLGLGITSVLYSLLLIYSPIVEALGGSSAGCKDGSSVSCSGYKCSSAENVGCTCYDSSGKEVDKKSCPRGSGEELFNLRDEN